MRKDRFMMWVSALFATMMVVRVVVISAPADQLLLGRAGTVDLGLAVGMIVFLTLTYQRLMTSHLNIWWLAPVALWLIAAVPLFRDILGEPMRVNVYPGPVAYWPDIPILLLVFFVFVAFVEPPGDPGLKPRQQHMEWAAAIVASVSILSRPYLLAIGFDQLPYIRSVFATPDSLMSVFAEIERQFNIVKDVGGLEAGLGNALTISLFCLALAALIAFRDSETERVSQRFARVRAAHARDHLPAE